MVYVGKSKEAVPDESTATDEMSDGMKLPPEYRGTRFDRNGEIRSYEEDGDALRHAEELFRRGYVFEEAAGRENAPEPGTNKGEAVEASASPAAAAHAKPRQSPRKEGPPSIRGALSGLLGSISTEEILIGAIILMLLVNGADDELLIMLVILLFC